MEYKFGKARESCQRCQRAFDDGETFYSAVVAAADVPDLERVEPPADAKPVPKIADGKRGRGKAVEKASDEDDAELARFDVCGRCWSEADELRVFSWWTSTKLAKPKRAPMVDPEFLWTLLARASAAIPEAERPPFEYAPLDVDGLSIDEDGVGETTKPDAGPAFTPGEARALAYLAALGLMRLRQVKLLKHTRHGRIEFLHFTDRNGHNRFAVLDPNLTDEAIAELERTLDRIAASFEVAEPSTA